MKDLKNKPKMVYILSPSYSGSTLLTFLMADHQSISTIGELKATSMGDVKKYRCSCGELLLSCEFWKHLSGELNGQGVNFSLENFGTHFASDFYFINRLFSSQVKGAGYEFIRNLLINYSPVISSEFKQVLNQNNLVSKKICEIKGGEVFLDGSKNCNRLLYFYRSGLWDVKVINLVRDELGLLNSMRKREKISMQVAIDKLIGIREEQKRTLNYLQKEDVFTIDYNELCKEPEKRLNQIYDFIGIDKIDAASLMKENHHVLGNAMRLASADEIKVDESWRRDLSEEDLSVYQPYAGKINAIVESI